MNHIIEAKNLVKRFGDLVAVNDLSFTVSEGEIFGFLGPNGAGKTTTIRMLAGLTTPTSGRAWIDHLEVTEEPVKVKETIGLVPETSNLYGELSTYDNLLFVAQLYGIPKGERAQRVEELLERFGLAGRARDSFQNLSRGMKRRLTIAAGLIHRPRVLFLDEPTTRLDVMSARALRNLVKGLKQEGCTIFLTTHYIAEAGELCDRLAIIVEGRLKALGTPAELQQMVKRRAALEVSFSRWDEDLGRKLESLPGIQEISTAERRVRMHTENVTQALTSIANFAGSSNLEILSLDTAAFTLEDAFVELTGLSLEMMEAPKRAQ